MLCLPVSAHKYSLEEAYKYFSTIIKCKSHKSYSYLVRQNHKRCDEIENNMDQDL